MVTRKTPPAQGLSFGPMIVACQWNISSPTGPALHEVGGSLCKSLSSFSILLDAIHVILDSQKVKSRGLESQNYQNTTRNKAGWKLFNGWRRKIEQNQEFHSPTEVGTVYIPHEKQDKIPRINQLLDMGTMNESCLPGPVFYHFATACCPSNHR